MKNPVPFVVCAWLGLWAMIIAGAGVLGWVAAHFIRKFW